MRSQYDWWARSFFTAKQWHDEAAIYEELAVAAEADGDTQHAERAKMEAAGCRQNARLRELGQEP